MATISFFSTMSVIFIFLSREKHLVEACLNITVNDLTEKRSLKTFSNLCSFTTHIRNTVVAWAAGFK